MSLIESQDIVESSLSQFEGQYGVERKAVGDLEDKFRRQARKTCGIWSQGSLRFSQRCLLIHYRFSHLHSAGRKEA